MVRRSWSPRDVLEATSFHGPRALLTASNVGVFEALAGRRATAGAVAKRIRCDADALARLLNVLVEMRLLRREGTKYSLSPGLRDLVTDGGGRSMSDLLRHRSARFGAWSRLEESLRTGRPVEAATGGADDPISLRAAKARRDSARLWAPVIAHGVELGPGRSFLVLGEGASVYASHFATARSRSRVIVVDHGASLVVGREFLAGRPESERVEFLDASPSSDWKFEGRADAAFFADALHALTPEEVRRLLRRTRKAMADGGRLFIRDRFLSARSQGNLGNSLYDLQLLLTTEGGRCHRLDEVSDWVRAAGFRGVAVWAGDLGEDSLLLCARV
jgi:hypothetical protein